MVEMEQVMWREGELFRQRQEKGSMEGVSSSMGSLALCPVIPDAKRSKLLGVNAAASEKEDSSEEGTTQGDILRAMRARGGAAARGKDESSWGRNDGFRLSRK